ncbi:hypothetical protein [Nonomuraea basaltis]|uniref:hypothetical protein n=1 Tax=Nonomuraea basaltis TaxID=2495887 RepID=UPI00110C535F|nr:hypothetical protein [Nonomuraea basaltis]TMR92620.1 hypothetical protein EJK15_43550 [Nonomuraea basaltis]
MSEVDLFDEDAIDRNWDALVACEVNHLRGDVDWYLDIYISAPPEARRPSPQELAVGLAERLETVVLYDTGLLRPSAYWLVTPEGRQIRARVYEHDGGNGARRAMAEPWWSWSDPQAWEANGCGEVTPAQREVIVGPPVRQPWLAWALLVFLVIVEGGAGVLGATPKHGLVPGGGPGCRAVRTSRYSASAPA